MRKFVQYLSLGFSNYFFQGDSGGPLTVNKNGVHVLAGITGHSIAPTRKVHSAQRIYKDEILPFLQNDLFKGLPDVYTRVSSFLQWIKNTILSNGGGISCSFSFIDSPRLGNTKSDLCYMCAIFLQKQKKEPENTTAFSSTFSEVNFPIQLK